MKYLDANHTWNIMQLFCRALIENFTELQLDYDEENYYNISNIIIETYKLDSERAIKYFKWLMSAFPLEKLDTKDDEINEKAKKILTFDLTYELVRFCCKQNNGFFLEFIKTNTWVLHNLVCATKWENHHTDALNYTMKYLANFGEFDLMKTVYKMYLIKQKDSYTPRDIGQFWNDFTWNFTNDEVDENLYNFIKESLDSIGVYAKYAEENFAKIKVSSIKRTGASDPNSYSDETAKKTYWQSFNPRENSLLIETLGDEKYANLIAGLEKKLYADKLYLKYHDALEKSVISKPLFTALLDNFSELRENYDQDSNVRAASLIMEIFMFDPEKALAYYKWLLQAFPVHKLLELQTSFGNEMTQTIAYTIPWYIFSHCNYNENDIMVNFVKQNPNLRDIIFNSVRWEKHDTKLLQDYMDYFIDFKDPEEAILAYEMFLKHQKNETCTDRDIGSMFSFIIQNLYYRAIDDKLYDFFEIILDTLGGFGEPGKNYLKKYIRKSQLTDDDDEDDCVGDLYDDDDDDDDDDDYNYEDDCVDEDDDKKTESATEPECEPDAEDFEFCTVCQISFSEYKKPFYSYLLDNNAVKVGDVVLAPVGYKKESCEATVVSIIQCYKFATPFPYNEMKTISFLSTKETEY